MKTFHIETFGCQMNVHDSEKAAGILATEGYTRASHEDEADFYVVNTCSVREKAESKLYSYLGQLGRRKAKGEPITIGVMGCVAQQEGRELLERAPYVDFVLGTHQVLALRGVVQHPPETREPLVATRMSRELVEIHPSVAERRQPGRAFITVMEGCDKFCTFCVIPYTRGRERYRTREAIIGEAEYLAGRGFVELQLLGQNVNCWRDGDSDFADLLMALEDLPMRWLRFITSHPAHLSQRIVDSMASSRKLCPQLHLPVQSGSNKTIERMGREHTREQYLQKVESLRDAIPGIALSTDIIVGFPGESETDFEETLELCARIRFDSMFSFTYSQRKYAAASRWNDDVPHEVKIGRLMRLQEMQRLIQMQKNQALVGRTLLVLVEGHSRKNVDVVSGHSPCNRVVNFVAREAVSLGTIQSVMITGCGPNSLFGKQVSA